MLISLGGLPGTGKTTIAREVATRRGAVHLRLDTIEQAVVDSGAQTHPVSPVGYYVARAVARDHLRQGLTVVSDCVNPLTVTREHWRAVAESAGVPVLEVEVVCSDPALHRRRLEGRVGDIPGMPLPTWEQVQAADYEAWTTDRLVLDTATTPVSALVDVLLTAPHS